MTARRSTDLKAFFETGDIPTEAQFSDLIDSVDIVLDGMAVDYLPQVVEGEGPMLDFPVNAQGIPQTNVGTMSIAGMPDMGPTLAKIRYEILKNSAARLVIRGKIMTTWPFYVGPCGPQIEGTSFLNSEVIFGGAAGELFYVQGDAYVPELAMPITNVSVDGVNNRTTFTVGTTGFKERLCGGDQARAWYDLPADCDPWGQWLGEHASFGVRDAGGMSSLTNYGRSTRYSFDQAARTVTLATTFGFTPTYLCTPPVNASTGVYTVTDSHPRFGHDVIRDISFNGRYNGVCYISYGRSVPGRPDPCLYLDHVRFARFYSFETDIESDSRIRTVYWSSALDDGPILSGIDSSFDNLQVAATLGVGCTFAADFVQCSLPGFMKLYYVSQEAATEDKARSIVIEQNGGQLDFDRLIVEDSAGCCIYINHLVSNVHIRAFEANNAGAIGLGAPGSVGSKPWWPCDVLRSGANSSNADIGIHGVIRCAFGNRDGQHVRSAWYVGGTNTTNWADTGLPHLYRNIRIHLDTLIGNYKDTSIIDYPDIRQDLWVSGGSYTTGDIVQVEDTPQAIRYRARVDHSGVTTTPSLDTTNWSPRGEGRNAWVAGFIIENFTGNFRPEFKGCQVVIDNQRDPSYHQRDLGNAGNYTVDFEQDVVVITRSADGESRYDVFAPEVGDGYEQIWRANGASAARTVVLEPGFRGRGATPWQAGAVATLSRPGSEMKTVFKDGLLHWIAHDQTETVSASSLTLDLSDYGKTILLTNSGAVTLTFPSASALPDGWFVTCIIDHATGSISSPSGVANASGASGQHTEVTWKKRGSVIRQYELA